MHAVHAVFRSYGYFDRRNGHVGSGHIAIYATTLPYNQYSRRRRSRESTFSLYIDQESSYMEEKSKIQCGWHVSKTKHMTGQC